MKPSGREVVATGGALLHSPAWTQIVADVLGYLVSVVGIISWFACLFTGAMPLGLRNLAAWIVRFTAQTHGYLALLTDRYPSFSTEPTE